MSFLTSFFKPKLAKEAFFAYFYRLPDVIQVKWFRDGDFIVGEVTAGEHKFVTQGKTADDFIEMVNDAIIVANSIPQDYIDVVRQYKTYRPSLEEENKLKNLSIKGSIISVRKDEKVLELAQ